VFASSTNVSSKLNFKVFFKFNYIHICVSDLVKELCSTVFKSSLQKSADKNFGRKKSNNAFFYFFPSKKISTDLFLFNSSNEKTKTLVFCWVMESEQRVAGRRDGGRDELVDLLREDSSDDDDDFFLHGPTK